MDSCVLKATWHTFKVVSLAKFLTDDNSYPKINTSSVERHNGTSRWRNQRKVRKTLAFSKSSLYHGWMSWLSVVQYNFCRVHGSLRSKDKNGFHQRTPAMASGLTDRIWSTRDWLLSPGLGGQG